MIDPYSRLMANQEKPKKPLISNPSNVDASISQRNSELDERLSALDRYSSSGRSDSSNNYFSSGVSESGQTQGSVLPSGVRITQAFGAYNPNVEVFSQGGRNWGTDFGVKEGTPLALPSGVWQVMEAYDRASGRGRIGNKENKGYGNSILVRNVETGETLRFSHLSGVNVMPGKTYQGGTVIGASGATGNVTGAHLDLEYKNPQGQYRDILKSPYAQNLFGSSGMGGGGGYGRGGGFNMGEIKESIGQKFGGLKDQVRAYPEAFMTNLPITPEKQKAFNTNIQYALGDRVGGKEGINNPNVMKAQGFNNWFFSPLMQVPYNVKEAVAPDKTGWERVGHGLNAGLAFTPGVDDLVSAGLNAVKTAVAERDGDFLGAFADGLVGNQYTGLGDAVTKRNPDKQNLATGLNLLEMPLRVAGGVYSVNKVNKGLNNKVGVFNDTNLDSLEVPDNILKARFSDQVIPEFKNNVVKLANDNNMNPVVYYQKVLDNIDKGIKIAEQQQKDFAKRISDFASENGVDFEVGGIKGKSRITTKVINEENGNISNIRDMNRAVVFAENLNDDLKSLVKKADQYFGKDKKNGYRIKSYEGEDLYKKVIVNFHGNKGQLMEMQITTPSMWKAKMELGGDELYQKWREIPDVSTGELKAEKELLFEKMKKIYDEAWKNTEG